MKLLHRLWLKINDIGEYDVKYGAYYNFLILSQRELLMALSVFIAFSSHVLTHYGKSFSKASIA